MVYCTNNTVCMMESKSAEQKETLVPMPMDNWTTTPRPDCPPAHRPTTRVAVLFTVMGLIIFALAAGLIFQMLKGTQSDKVNITRTFQDLEKEEKYDVFTVKNASRYLIYGWIFHSKGTKEGLVLLQTVDGKEVPLKTIPLQVKEEVTFFGDKATLVNGNTISIQSKSNIRSLTVHIQEL